VILLDTSGLLSAIDASQRFHRECMLALHAAQPPLLLSPFVLAELDCLLAKHLGAAAQEALLAEVARGAYQLEAFTADDVARASEVIRRLPGQNIGIADASIVVLAERHGATTVLSLDERHFRALRIGPRKRLRILPFDA
jgi:predicted nucleic acid-binding protein